MEKFNGYTNYETWRVNLEYIDGIDHEYLVECFDRVDPYDVAQTLKGWTEAFVNEEVRGVNRDGIVYGWVMAFLDDVNWLEIAEHVMEEHGIQTP